jgi:hypothetical protein
VEVQGPRLFSASADKTIRVWDIDSRRCERVSKMLSTCLCTPWLRVRLHLDGCCALHALHTLRHRHSNNGMQRPQRWRRGGPAPCPEERPVVRQGQARQQQACC